MTKTESITSYMRRLKQIIEKNISPENLIGAAYYCINNPGCFYGDDDKLTVAVFSLDDISSGKKLEDLVPYLAVRACEEHYPKLISEARDARYKEGVTMRISQPRKVSPDSLVHALDLEVENIFLTPLSRISEEEAVSLKNQYKDMLLQS